MRQDNRLECRIGWGNLRLQAQRRVLKVHPRRNRPRPLRLAGRGDGNSHELISDSSFFMVESISSNDGYSP